MRDLILKPWIEMFKIVGSGFFVGFIMGGIIGIQSTTILATTAQIVAVCLSWALAGGMLGATFAGCALLFAAARVAFEMNKAKRSQNNG